VTSATSKFDLSLSLAEVAGGLKGRQEYSTELFESATIDRILRDYMDLLEMVATDPNAEI
jgi:condensation domain-containing protein